MNFTPRIAGKGRAWTKNNVIVLHLQGSDKEMATQHGLLLKDIISTGALYELGTKNERLVDHSHLFKSHPILAKLAKTFIHVFIEKPIQAHIPRDYLDVAEVLARASGIPFSIVKKSLVQADTFSVMIKVFMGKYINNQLPGCTTAIALPQATTSGTLLHARNMDYPCVGSWEENTTVIYFDPDDLQNNQRAISVVSAGLHSTGITAVNSSGITLTAHFHCSKAASPFGTPVQIIGSEIIKRARTLSQAIEVAQYYERSAAWSFVLSSAKEKKAVVLQVVHGKHKLFYPENGILVHTNHFHDEHLKEDEILLSSSVTEDIYARRKRALEILSSNLEKVDLNLMAQILGDHYDCNTKTLRAQGNTISVITTVTSIISDVEKNKLWVSNRPLSPVSLGDYIGFSIDEDFKSFEEKRLEVLNWKASPTTLKDHPKKIALEYFRDAYIYFHRDFNEHNSALSLEKAIEAAPDEGHFHIALGHLRMRKNKVAEAQISFESALKCTLTPHMRNLALLFLAQSKDCLGDRSNALTHYNTAYIQSVDPSLKKEARRGLKKSYSIERAAKISFDLQFCDCFEYP